MRYDRSTASYVQTMRAFWDFPTYRSEAQAQDLVAHVGSWFSPMAMPGVALRAHSVLVTPTSKGSEVTLDFRIQTVAREDLAAAKTLLASALPHCLPDTPVRLIEADDFVRAEWARFDICAAHYLLECDYNQGGWLRERPSNQRRMESTDVQLHRLHYKPGRDLSWDSLSENARSIYANAALSFGLVDEAEYETLCGTIYDGPAEDEENDMLQRMSQA